MGKKYIPNEVKYRLEIPVKTIYQFQGEFFYEETLEEHFMLCIWAPLHENFIQYDFDYHAFEPKDAFGIELRVDGSRFDESSIVRNLTKEGLTKGLVVTKLEWGVWKEIYNDNEIKRA